MIAQGPPPGSMTFPDASIMALSAKINDMIGSLDSYLSPLLIEIEGVSDDAGEEDDDEEAPLAFLLLSTIMFMALLFMAQGMSEDIWTERAEHTLRRIVWSPQPVVIFLTGKMIGAAGLFFVVSLVALGIGYAYIGINPASLPLALVWATFSGTMLMALMTTLQLFCTSRRAGNILTMAVMFPLMMIGGSFFPFEAMPEWMASIGRLTPNGWALQQLKAIILRRIEPVTLLMVFVSLTAMIAALFAVCAHRLRRGFAQG
jgi:ABC-type multidrug transport system permease subunit